MEMQRGQKATLSDLTPSTDLEVALELSVQAGQTIDVSCFGLDAAGQLSDDRYFIFYNQKISPCGSLKAQGAKGPFSEVFSVNLSTLPASIQRLAFTVTVDGAGGMSMLGDCRMHLLAGGRLCATYAFSGRDFGDEEAVMVVELYRKDVWRFAAIGQGFNGGLSALLAHFGGQEVAPPPSPPAASPTRASSPTPSSCPTPASSSGESRSSSVNLRKVDLDKRMATTAPHLLSLAKKAEVSLAKHKLLDHRARVALCLDISGSMSALYKSGKIQRFSERILALGTRFDDDEEIDVFLFGAKAHEAGAMGIDNYGEYIARLLKKNKLEGGTYYGRVMELIRRHYFPDGRGGKRSNPRPDALPVYVMFLTDGQPMDKRATTDQITWGAYEPIFWQFMAIGRSKHDRTQKRGLLSLLASDANFEFLEQLDQMGGRYIDNANFFSVEDPEAIADDELYELMMEEYPSWVREAPAKGLLPGQ